MISICGAVIVWGGIEKTLAGANQDAEHRAHRRIQNGIHGLVWMILASVIVSTITMSGKRSPRLWRMRSTRQSQRWGARSS